MEKALGMWIGRENCAKIKNCGFQRIFLVSIGKQSRLSIGRPRRKIGRRKTGLARIGQKRSAVRTDGCGLRQRSGRSKESQDKGSEEGSVVQKSYLIKIRSYFCVHASLR